MSESTQFWTSLIFFAGDDSQNQLAESRLGKVSETFGDLPSGNVLPGFVKIAIENCQF